GFGELDLDESAAIWCAAVPTAPIVEGAEGEAALAAEGGDGSTAVDLGLMESCECLGVHGASVWGGGRSSNLAGGSCRDGVHRGFTLERTKELKPNMSVEEVKSILGEPYSAGLENGVYILNYHLQYYMNGSYPYVVAFDSNQKLVYFGFNNAESQRTIQGLQVLKGTPALPTTIQIHER